MSLLRGTHPTDVEIVEIADHLRMCPTCRRLFARAMYPPPSQESET